MLREARGHDEADRGDTGQQVIDRILAGPPYELAAIEEAALPYWLQAVRWFADVVPGLPTPAAVNRTLERRRMRSRLRSLAGSDFLGREAELTRLRAWYGDQQAGPMVVTGIGGVGKSTLVAQFAAELPESMLLLWLDFDRADLAPDDAVSVLGLLAEQVAVQRDGFAVPVVAEESWPDGAAAFGEALAQMEKRPPLRCWCSTASRSPSTWKNTRRSGNCSSLILARDARAAGGGLRASGPCRTSSWEAARRALLTSRGYRDAPHRPGWGGAVLRTRPCLIESGTFPKACRWCSSWRSA